MTNTSIPGLFGVEDYIYIKLFVIHGKFLFCNTMY